MIFRHSFFFFFFFFLSPSPSPPPPPPAGTFSELLDSVKTVADTLEKYIDSQVTAVSSGCELFMRFITLKADYTRDFEECKRNLIESGESSFVFSKDIDMRVFSACRFRFN